MTNDFKINANNTDTSCHIDLYNKELDKNISFTVSNVSLYTKDINKDNLAYSYDVDNTSIIEATTYTNSLLLIMDGEDVQLIPEDINRLAVHYKDEPIAQITATKVINEEGRELRSSLQATEEGLEVIIEEESVRADIILEFAPYIEFTSGNAIYLRTFNGLDYWYDLSNKIIYTIDKYNSKKEHMTLTYSHVSGTSYPYQVPVMISETVFFSNYKKCFFKLNGSRIDKIKDETSFFTLVHLYDNVFVTANKGTNAYTYNIIKFTDTDAAAYEIKDTYTLNLGKSVGEYSYTPFVQFNYGGQTRVSFYSYQFNSYLPATADQYLCANINRETDTFDFTGIEPYTFVAYKTDEHELVLNWNDRKYYYNGVQCGGFFNYPAKPFTLIEDGVFYLYSIGYSKSSSGFASFDVNNNTFISDNIVLDYMWNNGTYAGKKSKNLLIVADTWDVLKDGDIDKRHVRLTTKDDFIFKDSGPIGNLVVDNEDALSIKKESVQNKKIFLSSAANSFYATQRGNIVACGTTVSENTDIKIIPYDLVYFYFDSNYILTEDKDFNIYTSVSDIVRQVEASNYELVVDEINTIFDKTEDDKYDLSFKKWEDYTETFEDYPNTLIKWTNSTYDDNGLLKSDIRAKDGTYSGYMGREEKGGSSVPDYYSEFVTIGDKITFDYYNSFTQYNQYLKVYINDIQMLSDSYNSTEWKTASIRLTKNVLNTVKIFYEDSTVAPSNDKGFFIDNLTCKAPTASNEAEVYLKPIDLSFYDTPQGVNIIFNELEASSNVSRQLFYSINGGQEWLELTGVLPNVDNILLKAVFTKTSDDAYVRFDSVEVMPGEFTYTSYTDTSRKVYSDESIKPVLSINNTIDIVDGRYKLLFDDGLSIKEDFEGETPKIPYELLKNAYGKTSIVSENSYSGEKSCRVNWTYPSTAPSVDTHMRVGLKIGPVKSDRISLKACPLDTTAPMIRFYKDNTQIGYVNSLEEGYNTLEQSIDGSSEAYIYVTYSQSSSNSTMYFDDIELKSFLPVNYSYVESESLDLSIYPSELNCNIQVNDLQTTHTLDITNFYSVDNGEWQPFEGTLPNVANVRVKTVFTKDSVEDVVDASFESIIIKQGDMSNDINLKVDTIRYVKVDEQAVYDLERTVVKKLELLNDSTRQLTADKEAISDTTREVVNKEALELDTRRIVDKALSLNNDTKRNINKELTNYFDTLRKLYTTEYFAANFDTTRVVTHLIALESDSYREVLKSLDNSYDSERRVKAIKDLLIDTERQVVQERNIERNFDTLRIVKALFDADKSLDTLRSVYEGESPFETQINVVVSYNNGKLTIVSQKE